MSYTNSGQQQYTKNEHIQDVRNAGTTISRAFEISFFKVSVLLFRPSLRCIPMLGTPNTFSPIFQWYF